MITNDHSFCNGRVVETLVAAELRAQVPAGVAELLHYRDHANREVDLLLSSARHGKTAGIEVKSSSIVTAGDAKHLRVVRDSIGTEFSIGLVLYRGRFVRRLGDRIYAAPMSVLWS